MKHLKVESNFATPGVRHRLATTPGDDFYAMLLEAHRGSSDAQTELLNARLVLLLANHIGDLRVLQEALTSARGTLPSEDEQ